ncbi:solute carrier family 22 member 6-like, partial [Corapipo altera]|uniref:solute carrier family 22 member 6-like n=1 Tax=Corapipo altera TaxID=415028 RepID=UPI000FD6AC3D
DPNGHHSLFWGVGRAEGTPPAPIPPRAVSPPQWDLVCGSRGLRQLAQSLYMAGVLVGGIVFGGLSDRFGRRSVLTWCYLQLGAMGICSSFAPSFPLYCLFRFLTGTAFSGIVLNSVSLCTCPPHLPLAPSGWTLCAPEPAPKPALAPLGGLCVPQNLPPNLPLEPAPKPALEPAPKP